MKNNETLETLKKYIKEVITFDKKIYTLHRHSSKSGMSHSISIFVVYENTIINIDYYVALATKRKIDIKNKGVKISGCGMDMGFALLDDLFYSLKDDIKNINNWQQFVKQVWI